MAKNSFKISNYYKPTPKFWVRIGRSFLAVSLFVFGLGIYTDQKQICFIITVVGCFGTFLTNFFAENER